MARVEHEVIEGVDGWFTLRSTLRLTDATILKVERSSCHYSYLPEYRKKHADALRRERQRRMDAARHELESDLQKRVTNYLDRAGIYWWRNHLGSAIVRGRRVKNPMTGFPDLAGIVPETGGRMFVIELKHLRHGRLSPDQREWCQELKDQGVLVIVARCLEDVASQLKGPLL